MWFEFLLFLEVLVGGLLTGVLYSLVALGFVLIFKASGVFNFAQGAMVLFAALCFTGMVDSGVGYVVAGTLTLVVMFVLACIIERAVLRPMVNQTPISLFMVTIGIAYVLTGVGQYLWGSGVRRLDIGLPTRAIDFHGIFLNEFDLVAAVICGALVLVLAVFFDRTRIGRALRAVADDHQAAVSVGVPIRRVWVIVWTVAGAVSFVTGIVWGSKLGVQPALNLVALKALPVIILGGLTSIPGAICGGLIIGAGEKLVEVYLGPYLGGATESWVPYFIAIVFLAVRPEGLFGERDIRRI